MKKFHKDAFLRRCNELPTNIIKKHIDSGDITLEEYIESGLMESKVQEVGDLAAELCSDVIIVVDNKLGALNKTILTANAIKDKGLNLAGIVLNHIEPERDTASISNRSILEQTINPPFIMEILHDETEIEYPFVSID